MPIVGQLIPQLSDNVGGRGFIGIFDKCYLFECGQKLQVGESKREQFRWDLPRNTGQNIGDIADEFVVAQLQLLVLALIIVFPQHVLLHPFRFLMRHQFFSDALDVVFI